MVRTRDGSLGILGHSLRNKIPIVGNQGESKGYDRRGAKKTRYSKTAPPDGLAGV
jgi:hypothetical protein